MGNMEEIHGFQLIISLTLPLWKLGSDSSILQIEDSSPISSHLFKFSSLSGKQQNLREEEKVRSWVVTPFHSTWSC